MNNGVNLKKKDVILWIAQSYRKVIDWTEGELVPSDKQSTNEHQSITSLLYIELPISEEIAENDS